MKLTAGTEVAPNVRLVEPLAAGGMSEVWVAEQVALQSTVAVKILSEERFHNDDVALRRFELEAAISARVKSPHVVRTFDAAAEPGSPLRGAP